MNAAETYMNVHATVYSAVCIGRDRQGRFYSRADVKGFESLLNTIEAIWMRKFNELRSYEIDDADTADRADEYVGNVLALAIDRMHSPICDCDTCFFARYN
jgi:hypothetical protein